MFNFSKQGDIKYSELIRDEITITDILKQDTNNDFFGSFDSLKIIDFGHAISTEGMSLKYKEKEKKMKNDTWTIEEMFQMNQIPIPNL